jgi:hypothetical protein
MSGNERLGDNVDARSGDEPADAHTGDFAVYGGSPADRDALQKGIFPEDVDRFMQDVMGGFGSRKMNTEIGRSPFDDTVDELKLRDEGMDA